MVDICVLNGLIKRALASTNVHAMLQSVSSSREVANDSEGRKTVKYQSFLPLSSSTLIAIQAVGAIMVEPRVLQVYDAAADWTIQRHIYYC
jgi:hypothetical protein